jgi:hypothetical protein
LAQPIVPSPIRGELRSFPMMIAVVFDADPKIGVGQIKSCPLARWTRYPMLSLRLWKAAQYQDETQSRLHR